MVSYSWRNAVDLVFHHRHARNVMHTGRVSPQAESLETGKDHICCKRHESSATMDSLHHCSGETCFGSSELGCLVLSHATRRETTMAAHGALTIEWRSFFMNFQHIDSPAYGVLWIVLTILETLGSAGPLRPH
eukprot:s723_g5.t1